jgi:sterol desaturase/sphingolipid hydroxylase (fatty acid hydroxylase superfamily)
MDIVAWTVAKEGAIRFAIFASAFAILAFAEALRPDRDRQFSRLDRWKVNLGLGFASAIALRMLLPGAAVLVAVFAQMRGWGLLSALEWPFWIELALAIVLLDFSIYIQHVFTHRIPLLWRLHQVHHVDHEVDVTTALRFHPVEIVLSMLYKLAVVLALGAHPFAVIVFEIVLNACAMFNHANFKLPAAINRVLCLVLVTPDMHRIHHSQRPNETNSNFGFSMSLWDRLFGTYRAAPRQPLLIGLPDRRDAPVSSLFWVLALPFRSRT